MKKAEGRRQKDESGTRDSGLGTRDSQDKTTSPKPLAPLFGVRFSIKARPFALMLMLAGAIALAGCDYLPFGYTPIKDITASPANFEGKEVKLKGRAKDIVKLLGVQAFTLQDETGQITVVTGRLPAENSEVALKGTVKSAMIVGGAALGLRVEETQRLR